MEEEEKSEEEETIDSRTPTTAVMYALTWCLCSIQATASVMKVLETPLESSPILSSSLKRYCMTQAYFAVMFQDTHLVKFYDWALNVGNVGVCGPPRLSESRLD